MGQFHNGLPLPTFFNMKLKKLYLGKKEDVYMGDPKDAQIVSYPPSWQCCSDCGEWFDAVFSSSDPDYKVHECEK